MSIRVCLIAASLLLPTLAGAEIYKYVDEQGRVTYTNIPKKGAKKVDGIGGSAGSQRNNVGPSSFPRIDSQTQKKRDDTRKKILEDELASEQKALSEAQIALRDGEAQRQGDEARNYQKYLDRVKKLKDNVVLHERNIEALKKELSGLN